MCGVDAIQFLTGCTFGKGNLVHRDWGKNAYSFYRRSDGRAVRIVGRLDAWPREPEHQELFAKVRAGLATDGERARFGELHRTLSRELLERDPDSMFVVEEAAGPPPRKARIHATVPCTRCREGVMETRARLLDGRQLCPPCFDAVLSGEEPVAVRFQGD
jgi:formylmethanofuran dehydrogenase subunit E